MSRFIALLVVAAAVCGTAVSPVAAVSPTIADVVVGASSTGGPDANPDDFDLLLAALQATDLVGAVADESADLTVFAPNDAAFVALARDLGFTGVDEADALGFLVGALGLANIEATLLYHVSAGEKSVVDLIRA